MFDFAGRAVYSLKQQAARTIVALEGDTDHNKFVVASLQLQGDNEALAEVPNAVGMGLLPSPLLDTALFRLVSQQIKLGVYDPHDGRCACLPRLY